MKIRVRILLYLSQFALGTLIIILFIITTLAVIIDVVNLFGEF